jgi:phage shock protein C
MAAHVPSRLYRSRSQKMLAGVCGGLGEYFDVDPVLIRLLFVVTTFISGAGILAYIILWIVVPFEGDDTSRMDTLKRDFDDMAGRVREYMDPPRGGTQPAAGQSGPSSQGGPDVTGFHGGFGPSTPDNPAGGTPGSVGFGPAAPGTGPSSAGGPSSAASPFDTGREASMTADSTTARMPGTTDPNPNLNPTTGPAATTDRPETPETRGSAAADTRTGTTGTSDETPLEIDPPAGTGPAPSTPPFGSPVGSAAGTPPFGAPYGSPSGAAPGTPPFGAPFSGPYSNPAGGPYSNPAGNPAGNPGWSSATRDSGPSFNASTPPPSERKRRRQHWAGAILILIGTLILGNNLGLLWWLEFEYFMPILLVGVGAWLLFGRNRRG